MPKKWNANHSSVIWILPLYWDVEYLHLSSPLWYVSWEGSLFLFISKLICVHGFTTCLYRMSGNIIIVPALIPYWGIDSVINLHVCFPSDTMVICIRTTLISKFVRCWMSCVVLEHTLGCSWLTVVDIGWPVTMVCKLSTQDTWNLLE